MPHKPKPKSNRKVTASDPPPIAPDQPALQRDARGRFISTKPGAEAAVNASKRKTKPAPTKPAPLTSEMRSIRPHPAYGNPITFITPNSGSGIPTPFAPSISPFASHEPDKYERAYAEAKKFLEEWRANKDPNAVASGSRGKTRTFNVEPPSSDDSEDERMERMLKRGREKLTRIAKGEENASDILDSLGGMPMGGLSEEKMREFEQRLWQMELRNRGM